MRTWLVGLICLLVLGIEGAIAADASEKLIQGEIRIRPDMTQHMAAGDRLIIKIYVPSDGVEHDLKYQILPQFTLPLTFRMAPTIDMSGRTKWSSYIVEVFTDKDNDILSIVPGELIARTSERVPLGTTDVALELNALRK